MPVTAHAVANTLAPFRLESAQIDQVAVYVDLLVRWGKVINLTSILSPKQILERHFAESMVLIDLAEVEGTLLDVGSGAGFPGLALKIAKPELEVVLLEPVGKKRAFLKEVVRECGFKDVQVRDERVEGFASSGVPSFDFVTLRAVGSFDIVLPALARCLVVDGRACLWLTGAETKKLAQAAGPFTKLFEWNPPVSLTLSRDRQLWIGRARA